MKGSSIRPFFIAGGDVVAQRVEGIAPVERPGNISELGKTHIEYLGFPDGSRPFHSVASDDPRPVAILFNQWNCPAYRQ